MAMGSLRTLLALAVVLTHSYGFAFTGGQLSVQLFYVISGFLISYVLTDTKAYAKRSTFYLNRFLRLFPVYWVLAAGVVAMYLVAYAVGMHDLAFWQTYANLEWDARLALILSNIIVIGQDWIMFTGVRGGDFQFVPDFQNSEVAVWQGLLIAPAWTLGLELTFYLIAPFVLPRRKLLWGLLFASASIKAYLLTLGLGDPWGYRFFPAELCLFLLGAVSHQYLLPLAMRRERWAGWATAAMLIACLSFAWLPAREVSHFALILLCAALLPYLFLFQARHRWDKKIGELSYPVYIVHMPVIFVALFALGENRAILAAVVVPGTLIAAALLNRFVAEPVERVRLRVKAARSVPLHHAPSPIA